MILSVKYGLYRYYQILLMFASQFKIYKLIVGFRIMTIKIALLALLITLSFAFRDDPIYDRFSQAPQSLAEQKQFTFSQHTDHFDPSNVTTFDQRYWVIDEFFNPKSGPVFLYICGESTCKGVPAKRQWVVTLAQKLQGLVLVLEHRFYGESIPNKGPSAFSLNNLKLLNSSQALFDLGYFQVQMIQNRKYSISAANPWISVGGSYPGALSAWYKLKFDNFVVGAIASSAVINDIEDFKEFDEQIYSSSHISGDYCNQALLRSNGQAEKILAGEMGSSFKESFKGGEKLSDKQFMFFWADAIVLTIQYGGRTKICDSLKGKSEEDQFKAIFQNALNYPTQEYGSAYLKDEEWTISSKSNVRQWYYQCCTEFGFWQTPSPSHPMRSKWLDINFYKKFCSDSFGEGTWPNVTKTNKEYGGLNIKATNILFANGVEDPWRWAGLQTSKDTLISRVANCTNCGHCVDLSTPDITDSDELKKIRDEQFLTISEWVSKHWQSKQQSTGNLLVE